MINRRALISVSDKTNIIEFARGLMEQGIEILSTGGTKTVLEQAGIQTKAIEEVTNFPEMMDGRVKTLHPFIHGALLGNRKKTSHLEAMMHHQITPIDIVCVNLYPFKETINNTEATVEQAIEHIDIGGPSMLRSAAKNHSFVTVVVDSNDYSVVLGELIREGQTSFKTRQRLAAKVFQHTASYDALIAEYMTTLVGDQVPELLTNTYELKQQLRYGENNHQQATFYKSIYPTTSFSLANAKQLHGKELSYNNIRDADAALRIIREFEEAAVAVVKHMNPCGVGRGDSIYEAYTNAYEADPVSIFGGIVIANREVDEQTAKQMNELFLEIIIAPSFSSTSFAILAKKKNLRLLTLDFSAQKEQTESEQVSALGGLLVQEQDIVEEDQQKWRVVTKRKPTEAEWQALAFAWKVVKHVKSNAIVVTNDQRTLGIGAGQMNQIGAMKLAIQQAKENMQGAVVASDAFFPMNDSVAYAGKHDIQAIIQPGGSIKDQESIEMADKLGMTMVFTNVRHFKH